MNKEVERLIKQRFARRVRQLRRIEGMRAFARSGRVAHTLVWKLENDVSNPTLTTIVKLALALNVTLAELFQGVDISDLQPPRSPTPVPPAVLPPVATP